MTAAFFLDRFRESAGRLPGDSSLRAAAANAVPLRWPARRDSAAAYRGLEVHQFALGRRG